MDEATNGRVEVEVGAGVRGSWGGEREEGRRGDEQWGGGWEGVGWGMSREGMRGKMGGGGRSGEQVEGAA